MSTESKQRSFVDPQILAQLSALPLLSRKSMLGSVSGRHSSPHRGASVEFAEYRKYVPGDDLRRMDWRAFARSDRYYIKEFEADTNLRAVFVLDTSGSMEFSSTGTTKLHYAKQMIASLSYLAIQQGDAAGLACAANGITQSIPPRRNPAHLSTIYNALEAAKPKGETGLVEVLHELAETVRQRALIVIFSDLFIDTELLRSCFEHLRFRKHDVSVFHLLDPEELGFTFHRPTRFVDLEGGVSLFADPAEIADRYHRALADYLQALKRVVLETAVDYRRVSIDAPFAGELTQFLVDRAHFRSSR